jgi:hypothetical protein
MQGALRPQSVRMMLAWIALFGMGSAPADVKRCRMSDGSMSFVDGVCPANARETGQVAIATTASPKPEIGPWRCAQGAASLAALRVPADQAKKIYQTLPSAQGDALKHAMSGLAMGLCGGSGGCRGASVRLHRERNGVVFVCAQRGDTWGNADTELRVSPSGRIYHRRGNADIIRVTDPYADPAGDDFEYRIHLDGRRIERRGDQSLKQLEAVPER